MDHPTFQDPITKETVAVLSQQPGFPSPTPDSSERVDEEDSIPTVETQQEEQAQDPSQFDALMETWFQSKFGKSSEQIAELLQRQEKDEYGVSLAPLAKIWGVQTSEASERVDRVLAYIQTLSPKEQQRLDKEGTVDDIMDIWDKISKKSAATSILTRSSQSAPQANPRPQYDFTEAEIDEMDEATYAKNSAKIFEAYANNRVQLLYKR